MERRESHTLDILHTPGVMGTNKEGTKDPSKLSYIRYNYFTNDFAIIFCERKRKRKKKSLNYPKEPEIVIPDIHSKYCTSGSKIGQKENSKTVKIL